jgi:hypothetical protein
VAICNGLLAYPLLILTPDSQAMGRWKLKARSWKLKVERMGPFPLSLEPMLSGLTA